MKSKTEYLVDTDVLFDHLCKNLERGRSYLVKLMTKGICFTTVLNASELMMEGKNANKTENIKNLLSALKVLGIHARYSLLINQLPSDVTDLRDALFLVTAQINKLNIVTLNPKRYNSDKIEIFHPDQIVH